MSDIPGSPAPSRFGELLGAAIERNVRQVTASLETYRRSGGAGALHDLRVSLRRAAALARLFRGWPAKEQPRAVRLAARDLRRRLSPSRQRAVSKELLRRAAGKAAGAAARSIVAALPALAPVERAAIVTQARIVLGSLEGWASGLRGALEADPAALGSAREIEKRLRKRLSRSRDALVEMGLPSRRSPTTGRLHRLRIAGKELRYELELLEAYVSGTPAVLKTLKGFQDALGDAHDLAQLEAEAKDAVSRLEVRKRGPAEALLPRLHDRRRKAFAEATRAWKEFCPQLVSFEIGVDLSDPGPSKKI